MHEDNRISDALDVALTRARGLVSGAGIVGYGVAVLRGPDGEIKQVEPFANLVTDKGDEYYAKMATALVGTPNTAQPTKANGMKLGTASTAVHKSTAGAAAIASGGYIAGSNNAFDSAYPQTAAVGTDQGWNATYQTTWGAGDATNATINEVAIVNDQASDATSTVANTYARAVISTVNKAAGDTLTITWSHKFLGA